MHDTMWTNMALVKLWHCYNYMVIQLALSCYILVVLYTLLLCPAAVVLDSTVGMRGACPGETVTYTCTVTQGFQLDWIVEPFLPTSARIQFTSTALTGSSLNCNTVANVRCEDFDFVATLTATANPTVVMRTTLADMTSTLAFNANSRLNGTVVQCRGSTADSFPINSSTVNVAGTCMLLFWFIAVIASCCLFTLCNDSWVCKIAFNVTLSSIQAVVSIAIFGQTCLFLAAFSHYMTPELAICKLVFNVCHFE